MDDNFPVGSFSVMISLKPFLLAGFTSYSKCSVTKSHSLVFVCYESEQQWTSLCILMTWVWRGQQSNLFCFCCHFNSFCLSERKEKTTNLQQIIPCHTSHNPHLGPGLKGLSGKAPQVLHAGWRDPLRASKLRCSSGAPPADALEEPRGKLGKLEACSSTVWMSQVLSPVA